MVCVACRYNVMSADRISGFLLNVAFRIAKDNCFSSVTSVLSGVPHGIGPIGSVLFLFIFFINDVSFTCIRLN